jgi:hypothetical protein
MRNHLARPCFAPLALGLLLFGTCNSAMAQAAPAPMLDCRLDRDDIARLRCYDREADKAMGSVRAVPAAPALASPAAPAAAPAAALAPAAVPVAVAKAAAPAVKPAPPAAADRPKAVDNATITGLQLRADKGFVVQLDNGQTWEQSPGEQRVSATVGQVVRIQRMLLGSFLMIGPHSRWTSHVRLVAQP